MTNERAVHVIASCNRSRSIRISSRTERHIVQDLHLQLVGLAKGRRIDIPDEATAVLVAGSQVDATSRRAAYVWWSWSTAV